ncbi:hypothetical protein BC936DRAFT_143002 [Jimgerdemannia flammicorona]|uniref:Fungal-type protein kinase domain-containing protein n=1 Tax=Jimgerdemannia flammicorona TaxID=994334 RepID=A0A433DEI9_9FUNG|nr:hypothetical protein BC936DRAFT_143002 [Jimgerdemannia flammicorona]
MPMALTETLILFAVDHGLPMSNGAFHWRDVRIVGEFKSDVAFDTHRTDIQLAGYAREVFGAQPNRRFVQGFFIYHIGMRLLFGRVGGISSPMTDIQQDIKTFARVIAGLSSMNNI